MEKTPEILTILKEADVVDAGGRGLMYLLEGALGDEVVEIKNNYEFNRPARIEHLAAQQDEDIKFGYCTEFILDIDNPKKFNKEEITQKLEKNGSSMVVVQDDNLFKVHIHTKKPGSILNLVNSFGQFVKIKIENMTIQANNSKDNANNFNNKTKDDLNRIL